MYLNVLMSGARGWGFFFIGHFGTQFLLVYYPTVKSGVQKSRRDGHNRPVSVVPRFGRAARNVLFYNQNWK